MEQMVKKLTCNLAVIPMRKEPSDKSEMVNQVLFGETMDLLQANKEWILVRLHHDNYEGWVDKKQVLPCNSDHTFYLNPIFVRSLYSDIHTSNTSLTLPAGAILNQPDAAIMDPNSTEKVAIPSSIVSVCMMFLNTPYLWGGRTLMGIDCSGFTQIVFRLLGIRLHRDAYQQAEQGEAISFVEESKTGDLAFFENTEGRLVHVGIVLNETDDIIKIIHASGKVRVDKLDHLGIFNKETGQYTHSLRIIKRHQF